MHVLVHVNVFPEIIFFYFSRFFAAIPCQWRRFFFGKYTVERNGKNAYIKTSSSAAISIHNVPVCSVYTVFFYINRFDTPECNVSSRTHMFYAVCNIQIYSVLHSLGNKGEARIQTDRFHVTRVLQHIRSCVYTYTGTHTHPAAHSHTSDEMWCCTRRTRKSIALLVVGTFADMRTRYKVYHRSYHRCIGAASIKTTKNIYASLCMHDKRHFEQSACIPFPICQRKASDTLHVIYTPIDIDSTLSSNPKASKITEEYEKNATEPIHAHRICEFNRILLF